MLTYSESEFQRVVTATENARVPACVLIMGTDNKSKPDERAWVLEKAWQIETMILQKKEFDRQGRRV